MRSMHRPVIFLLHVAVFAAAFLCTEAAHAGAACTAEPLDACIATIAAELDPHVADALSRIDGTGRRLLALRSYLRSSAHLADHWSWTQGQIAAYQESPEYGELQRAIDRVNASFMNANPGYELWVNPEVRSLDVQIEHWNTNESVAEAAEGLAAAASEQIASPAYEKAGPASAARKLQSFLGAYVPVPTPAIAAPGLSLHGQVRAVDFQVHQGGRVIAGPEISTMEAEWDAAGWSARLEAAVRAAGGQFVGPLASPREPWHYTFTPESVASAGP
jgi:hypothetical protein